MARLSVFPFDRAVATDENGKGRAVSARPFLHIRWIMLVRGRVGR